MTKSEYQIQYDISLIRAYALYKEDWCKERGYSLAEVEKAEKEDSGYFGEMYACRNEFEDIEFLDREYIKTIMGEQDFWCYDKVMDYLDKNPNALGNREGGKMSSSQSSKSSKRIK